MVNTMSGAKGFGPGSTRGVGRQVDASRAGRETTHRANCGGSLDYFLGPRSASLVARTAPYSFPGYQAGQLLSFAIARPSS